MQNKADLLAILAFATSWIGWIFVTPLSMNLLLRYVQQSKSPPFGLSPYLFVVLIFIAPVASSVSYQSALYRLAQLGLRLRALLRHAIYAKLLRIKAGGGSEKHAEKGTADEQESAETTSGGGSEAVGRVNNLAGTDIDTITSSLPSALQLFGVLPKLVVSLVFLYFLLGWSAFIALASIVLLAPISVIVSCCYSAVQEQIMKATDKHITLVQELLNSIRTLKMFAWEEPSMKHIGEVRDMELGRITKRVKVCAGMMFLSPESPPS
jgi:ABC-type multidrug transport system fused ATPase/permease subunit